MTDRPALDIPCADTAEVVNAFVAGLQAGHDQRNADILNQQFAADVAWGSPYAVRHVMRVNDDVVIAHVARVAMGPNGEPLAPTDDRDAPFSEMAMYVLVRRNGDWWLAAGQNTPMRPGGAVRATA